MGREAAQPCCTALLLSEFFLPRQASEQYSTESQFLAQALRQVMLRPHKAQSLLGSDCLLPLKPDFIRLGNV
jgi:hypothetical protein